MHVQNCMILLKSEVKHLLFQQNLVTILPNRDADYSLPMSMRYINYHLITQTAQALTVVTRYDHLIAGG